MSTEIHGGGGSDGTPSRDSTVPAEVSESSVRTTLSEIEKGVPAATGLVGIEGDNGEAGVQGDGGSFGAGDKPGEDESRSRYVVAGAGVSKKDAPAVENDSFVIDIRPQRTPDGSLQGDRICRICHLSSEQVFDSNTPKVVAAGKIGRQSASFGAELILLGCGCKDDLGTAHRHCAEAWFKLKGNRFCEICGKSAKHVFGVGDNRFMEEWHDERGITSTSTSSSEGGSGCWRRQPLCNFLMACLVMAFVLPWFFRVNLF